MRNAATVLLLRDREASGFEVFMVRRHAKSGFMGGAYVFPGGKLDDADCAPHWTQRLSGLEPAAAERLGEQAHLDEHAARGLFVAAVRETLEEAGVLLGASLDPEAVRALRQELAKGGDFWELLQTRDARLTLGDVVPFARWITPVQEPRRYDTRFFLASAPGDQRAEHDRTETVEHAWWSPAEALEAHARGEIQLPPPTARNLLLIRDLPDTQSVLNQARACTPPRVEPVVAQEDGNLVIALPGDPLHPEGPAVLEGPTRMVLENGRWWAR